MSLRQLSLCLLSLGALAGMAGCNCCGKKPCSTPACRDNPGYIPPPGTTTAPPAQPAFPGPPPTGATTYPGNPPPPVFPSSPAPTGTGTTRYYAPIAPAPASSWQPSERNGVRLAPPATTAPLTANRVDPSS